jgi:hypothetical protein
MARMYIEDAHQKYAQTAQESADLGVDAFQGMHLISLTIWKLLLFVYNISAKEHTDMEIPDPYDDVALKDAGEQNNCKPLRLDLLHQ